LIGFERRITNIANGKDLNEINVKAADVKNACERIEQCILQFAEEKGIDLVEFESNINRMREREEELYSHSLYIVTDKYSRKAYDFSKNIIYNKNSIPFNLKYDYETVSYYSELLPIKMHAALCGVYARGEDAAYDFILRNGVAQLSVCKKSIELSLKSLRIIGKKNRHLQGQIRELLAILYNIFSRIKLIENEL